MINHRTSLFAALFFAWLFNPVQAQEELLDLYYSGRYEQVIARSSQSLVAGDTSLQELYLKALAEEQLGRSRESISTLQFASRIDPQDSQIKRTLAGQLYKIGDYLKAQRLYASMVQTDSMDVASWIKLAEMASFRQDYKGAIPLLQRILMMDSNNLTGLLMLGEILEKLHQPEALTYFVKAYRLYPDNQKAAYTLANLYIQSDSSAKSLPIIDRVLKTDSTNIKFQKLSGYAYYKLGQPDTAIIHFVQAVALGDSSLFTFKFMGISQYMKTDFASAIETLKTANLKDSTDAEVHFFLGACLATTTQKAEAIIHLDRSLELVKPSPSVVSRIFSEKGNIKRLEMEYETAYFFYEKAWEADTTNPMSLYFMASILDNSMHRSKEALVDYQRFIDRLDLLPPANLRNPQWPSIRSIVEDRITSLKEELFFLDE